MDPQEDKKVGVNKISTISIISVKRISAAEKVWIITDCFRL